MSRCGPWRLTEPLGRGGMGTVWRAERADGTFAKDVAIKLLRPGASGPQMLRRFDAERRLLARLEHPAIAHLLDGGATDDGLPWLAMELVMGLPIDQHCDDHGLQLSERLELFARVGDAVSHAHAALIVHRDIKPANVLVTPEGEPKLLDFGIARLLDDDGERITVEGAPLTPRYASPEQLRGEPVTTASDVYSMGVLLYELLTGVSPHADHGTSLVERVAHVDTEPIPASQAVESEGSRVRVRQLEGDLDTILEDTLLAMGNLGGVYHAQGRLDLALPFIEDAAERYPGVKGVDHPKTLFARRNLCVADVMQRRFAEAERIASDVYERYRRVSGEDHPDTMRALEIVAASARGLGRFEQALRAFLDVLAWRQVHLGPGHLETLDTMNSLATLYSEQGRYEEASALHEETLDVRRQTLGDDHPQTLVSLMNVAGMASQQHRWQDAERLFAQAVAGSRKAFAPGSFDIGAALAGHGKSLRDLARYHEAEAALLEAYEILTAILGPEDPRVVSMVESILLLYDVWQKPDQLASWRETAEARQQR